MDLLSRVHPAVDLGAPNRVMTARRLTAAPSHAATRMLPNLVEGRSPVEVRSRVMAAVAWIVARNRGIEPNRSAIRK